MPRCARRSAAEIEPSYELVLHFEGQVGKLWVQEPYSVEYIYTRAREWLGCDVTAHQITKKETYALDKRQTIGEGVNLGHAVHLRRACV